jgi:hypothetical protein
LQTALHFSTSLYSANEYCHTCFNRTLKFGYTPVHHCSGTLLHTQQPQRLPEAERLYLAAIDSRPQMAVAYLNLALAREAQGKGEQVGLRLGYSKCGRG